MHHQTPVQAAVRGAKALHTPTPIKLCMVLQNPAHRCAYPTSQISYSLKIDRIKSKEPVIKEARSCKVFLSDGKEDKMVTSVPSGSLLFFLDFSTQPTLKSSQEILPAPITSQFLCYSPPEHKQAGA